MKTNLETEFSKAAEALQELPNQLKEISAEFGNNSKQQQRVIRDKDNAYRSGLS